jgi:hypothetical protein
MRRHVFAASYRTATPLAEAAGSSAFNKRLVRSDLEEGREVQLFFAGGG